MATAPVRIEPPAAEAPLTGDGQHTKPWADYHQSVSDRLGAMPALVRKGAVDGADAAAGDIGEVLTASALGVALTTNVSADVISLPLTAGDWEVWGVVQFNPAPATVTQRALVGVGPSALAAAEATQVAGVTGAGAITRLATAPWRLNTAAAATVYLTALANFTVATMAADGTITARRVR